VIEITAHDSAVDGDEVYTTDKLSMIVMRFVYGEGMYSRGWVARYGAANLILCRDEYLRGKNPRHCLFP
jgi:hypothetical protein